jgi:uncharacterized protein YndB with AHSA1/START domain
MPGTATEHYGTVEQRNDGRSQLRFTRTLSHPQARVWRAITEPDDLRAWFPTTIEGERAAGAALRFSFPGGQAPPFEGEMIAYERPSLMELRWGSDIVRLELLPAGDGTELTLLDRLDEHGKAARDGAGWHTCLDRLAAHMHGDPSAQDSLISWKDLMPQYVESFGPEAATIPPPAGFE